MEWKIAGVRVRLHPLMLLLAPLCAMLGGGVQARALLVSLAVHEGAHLLAARLLGIRVEELRLMPFGGSMDLGNLYLLTPARLLIAALAGPAANLVTLFVAAALAQWRAISPQAALQLCNANATLLLFNLLPALPLDGGRALYALTHRKLGQRRAARLGVRLGRALAVLLVAFAAYGCARTHRLNLSPLIAALFILSSSRRELDALTEADVESLARLVLKAEDVLPAKILAVDGSTSARTALRGRSPASRTLYAVYSGGVLQGFTDDRSLLRAVLADPAATVARADIWTGSARRFENATRA